MTQPDGHVSVLEATKPSADMLRALTRSEHHSPHDILGAHPVKVGDEEGCVVRAFHPDARSCELLYGDRAISMDPLGSGVFAAYLPKVSPPVAYRLRFGFADGASWERDDPYRFTPTVGDTDQYLFNEGTHRNLWQVLGARAIEHQGVSGTAFAVWAPNAKRVSVVGEFNQWDGRLFPMRTLGSSGIWELFVPGVGSGAIYKYEIKTQNGDLRIKTDPLARRMQNPPETASIVFASSFEWNDEAWMKERAKSDIRRQPLSIYELHLGSWRHVDNGERRSLSYREIAEPLVNHVKALGFTHVELLPITEHAFYPSWGYQVTGYYAPTARYGTPDDFRYFVDYCHQHGIGVIIDWVPAHFPRDDFALRRFDGTALYEHEDSRLGEHPDWGTLIFNYGRAEVKSFLIANAIYWLKEFHVDGLRVDAVASMLYLDYSRQHDQWLPNKYGGRENLEAIEFIRAFNVAIQEEMPGAMSIAEESTAWGGITNAIEYGGLGFTFKWNMGWMHDTLLYFQKEAIHRKYHQDQLTFAMLYENTERFINSISHDEVVHGKGSLIDKMPGDIWQKFANLRLLIAYQYARPGKQLLFMGTELAQHREWSQDDSLDWHLADDPRRQGLFHFIGTLGKTYQEHPALWQWDPDPASFEWIDASDRDNSVLSFVRRNDTEVIVVVLNLTPVPRDDYRIGAPKPGKYTMLINTDDTEFGGSGYWNARELSTDEITTHGRAHSLNLNLPPLAALILRADSPE